MRTASDFAIEAVEEGDEPTQYIDGMTKAELAYTVSEVADLAGVSLEAWDEDEYEEYAATGESVNVGRDELSDLIEAFAAVANE